MWDSLNEDTLSRLPRSGSDGQANWKQCFAKLEEFRTYGDDWDGQGAAFGKPAATITAEVIDSAVALATKLQRLGVANPEWTVPDVRGGVAFEWDAAGGSIQLEIAEPEGAEVVVSVTGRPVEFLPLCEPVMV